MYICTCTLSIHTVHAYVYMYHLHLHFQGQWQSPFWSLLLLSTDHAGSRGSLNRFWPWLGTGPVVRKESKMRHKVVYMHVKSHYSSRKKPWKQQIWRGIFEKWWNATMMLLGVKNIKITKFIKLLNIFR